MVHHSLTSFRAERRPELELAPLAPLSVIAAKRIDRIANDVTHREATLTGLSEFSAPIAS